MEDTAVVEEAAAPTAGPPEVVMIGVDRIAPSPRNRRCSDDDQQILSLALSIEGVGLINPISVRPVGDGGSYEIVTGERRWRAFRLLGLPALPCVVKDIGERQAHLERITENLQRQSLDPLEEGDGVLALLDYFEGDYEAVAKQLGFEDGWVRRRAKLPNLGAAWREELAKPDTPYHRIRETVGSLEEIAMLPHSTQEDILADHVLLSCKTVKDIRLAIARRCMNLDHKPWSRDFEKKKFSSAKRCDACVKRSDRERTLFSGLHDVVDAEDKSKIRLCLDRECWSGKVVSWCKTLMEENPNAVPLWDGSPSAMDSAHVKENFGLRVLSYYEWSEKPASNHTRQALGIFLGGARIGSVADVWLRDSVEDIAFDSEIKQRREEERREREAEEARTEALRKRIGEKIPEDVFAFHECVMLDDLSFYRLLFNLAVWFGVGVFGSDSADMNVLDTSRASSPGIRLAWAQIRDEVLTRICEMAEGEEIGAKDTEIAEYISALLNIDLAALKEEAAQ